VPPPKITGVRVSVALASFNGGPFLRDQLASLQAQSRLPDELVVSDDGSSDDTLEIVSDFKEQARFPVRIHRNENRLGWADNFFKATFECSGDLVAFCDQDDVWNPEKLARCAAEFEADDQVQLVVHSGRVLNSETGTLGTRYPRIPRRRTVRGPGLPPIGALPGYAVLVRRAIFEGIDVQRRPREVAGSDALMAHEPLVRFLAATLGRIVTIPDELVLYRRHGGNTTGLPERDGLPGLARAASDGSYAAHAELVAEWRAYLAARSADGQLPPEKRRLFAEQSERCARFSRFMHMRARLRSASSSRARAATFAELARSGAYVRPRRDGGLGAPSALKDGLSIIYNPQT
jgi:glycosyltransferase involved in cell wall biosynthesis